MRSYQASRRLLSINSRSLAKGRRQYATPASALDFSVADSNGYKIAAQEAGASPTAAITLCLKAGPRYEPLPGMAHTLKNFVFRTTNKRSALRLIRETEVYGGVLSSSLSREHLFLTAEFLRGDEDYFAEILGSVISDSKFAEYEYAESVVPSLEADYSQATSSPLVLALDNAHSVAFRTGLGNSLFATPHQEVPFDMAHQFATSALSSPSNIAVVASNVNASSIKSLVGEYFTTSSSSSAPASSTGSTGKYYGGESRIPHTSDLLVVGFQGGPVASPQFAVLKQLLGGEASVKWSTGTSPLSANAPGAKAFNFGYSDLGLFGFTVQASAEKAGDVAQKAVAEIKKVAKGGLKQEDVKRAIAKAKFEAATLAESRSANLEWAASQVLASGSVPSLSQTFAGLDKVTGDDLAKAAAAALKTTPSLVAVGNTHKLPYSDQLGL